jgi:hypothetical protein
MISRRVLVGAAALAALLMSGAEATAASASTAQAGLRPASCCSQGYMYLTNSSSSYVHPNGQGNIYSIGTNSNQFKETLVGRVSCSNEWPFMPGTGWNCGSLENTTVVEIEQVNDTYCLTAGISSQSSDFTVALEELCNGNTDQLFVNSSNNYYYNVGESDTFFEEGGNQLAALTSRCNTPGCWLIFLGQGNDWQQWSWTDPDQPPSRQASRR